MNKRLHNSLWSLAFAAGVASPAVPAIAADDATWEIEEILVTARKRVENLQDVGMSLSALGALEIERKFATDIRDLVDISPNLVIDDTAQGPGGVASIYIRGIGVSEVEKNFDPAVGVVVDGIFLGTMTGSLARSIDLERVEVLRGPQGTLFGRNTIGGVINLQRTKPTGELGAKLRLSYGSYETLIADSVSNFALGEQIAVKITGSYHNQGKGYYKNLNTGGNDGEIKYSSGGINVLFTPTDNIEFEYTLQLETTDQDTPPLLNVSQPNQLFCFAFGFCSPDTRTPVSGSRYAVLQGGFSHGPASFDVQTHIAEIGWDINEDYRLDYIFGYWETKERVLNDWDGVAPVLFHTSRPAEYDQTTHELRLSHSSDGPFNWVLGAYLWDSQYEVRLRSFIGFAVPNLILDLPQTTKQKTDSWAVFFEGDYDVTDQLTLTLGGRYTEDDKDTDQSGIVNAVASDSWNEFTPKVGVKYNVSGDAMVYATYSVGYRSGGFNGRVDSVETAITPYDQETVDNYEVGLKTEWLGRRLRINGAVFYMDYKDKQEELQLPSATSGTGQVTRAFNAATATVKGIELDVLYYASEELTIRANLGLLDAGYNTFLVPNPDGSFTDYSDLDFRRAPKVTATIGGTYEWAVGEGTAWISANWHYIGPHEVDFANKAELHNRGQHLIDASVNYQYDNYEFSFFGRNLAKEDGYSIGFDVASLWSYAATRAPRTFGAQISYRFGG